MSRIDSGKVNLGSSFVLSNSDEEMRSLELVNAKKVAAEIIAKAQMQAKKIIEDAQNQAEQHMQTEVSRANSQVESITEQARKEGFEKGYNEGQEQIRKDLVERIENVDKFARAEFEIKKRIIKSAHSDIVNLVITLSDKICRKKLAIDDEILYNLVKCAINELKEKEAVTLIVNPNMAQKMYEISDNLKDEILSLQSIKIVEDVSVSEDGAIVESISSRVDSRVSSQIDEVAQKLLVELQSVPEDRLANEVEHVLAQNPENT